MIKTNAAKIGFLLLCCLGVIGMAQDLAEPPDHGCYYRGASGWQKLEPILPSGTKVRGFSGMTQIYRETNAPMQLSDRRPIFYIKTTPDKQSLMESTLRSMVIVRLEQKKDHRELQVIKSGLIGAKVEIDKKRMPDITVHAVNSMLLTITPNEDLSDGEYLITYDSLARLGYDFGITAKK